MTTLTLNVPEKLENEHEETVRFLAAKLYEGGKVTLGQAAAMVGMEKWDFAELLSKYGINFLDDSANLAINDAQKF